MVLSSERSLMDKFELNIDQLDYKYIENCSDVKQLEKILKVLRSGEEGLFPHLISFCEQKLSEKDPENALLKKENMIKRYADLPETERMHIQQDIKDWSNSYEDKEYKEQIVEVVNGFPPIRGQAKFEKETTETNKEKCIVQKMKSPTKPRDYKDRDRFNVEDELQKLDDKKISQEKTKTSLSTTTELCDKICVNGLTLSECEHISDLENIKGNEAFKAKEYEEAVIYYSRSLSAYKTTKALNNRAQAYIKLKNYKAAVKDCIEVLDIEPNNIKAIYRRGLAHKEAGLYNIAAIDFYMVLDIEPECQDAKNQLQQMENIKFKKGEVEKILIEELDSSTNETDKSLNENNSFFEDETATKITIEEIVQTAENEKHILLDDLCHFSDERDEERPLSQKVKSMFMVVQNKESISKAKNSCKQTNSSSNLLKIKNWSTENIPNDKTKTNVPKSTEVTTKIASLNPRVLDSRVQDVKKSNCEDVSQSARNRNALKDDMKKSESLENKKVLHRNENNIDTPTPMKEENIFDNSNFPTQESKEQTLLTKLTPFEFINTWFQENAYKDSEAGADTLLKIKPQELPRILTNKIDGQLLVSLLKAIGKLNEKGKCILSFKYLNNLIKTPRVGTIAMFLTKKEKDNIHNLFSVMEKKDIGNTLQARNILNIMN